MKSPLVKSRQAVMWVMMVLLGCQTPAEAPRAEEPPEEQLPAESCSASEALTGPHSAWLVRHGLTDAQYQVERTERTEQGYRLADVSGYEAGGGACYAVIWEKSSEVAWRAFHGLDSERLQATLVEQRAQGYRPRVLNGYNVGGAAFFAVIFHQDGGSEWVARHDLSESLFQSELATRVEQGYRLVHLSGYMSGGEERYATLWDKASGPAWKAHHRLTASELESTLEASAAQGYQLTKLSGYDVDGTDRYAALFEATPGAPIAARHGLSSAAYQREVTDLKYQGYAPVIVATHNSGRQPVFSLLWRNAAFSAADLRHIDDTVQQAMAQAKTVGLSLAITHRGRLVFAKGYGDAQLSGNTPVNTSHRFRIASVSKPLTAIGIMRLMERGQLRLTDRVFGKSGLLGETFGLESTYKDSRVLDITVQHLLEHTAGGWDNSGADGTPDPMSTYLGLSHEQLIQTVLRTVPLEFAPGTTYQYSNFGYSILGRVIERVTGLPYETYMRDHVFLPSGATRFAVGGDTLEERLPDEVVYAQRGPGAYSPYRMQLSRMDAHGGWVVTPIDLLRVAVRVDGFATVPDLLSQTTLATMTTRTTALDPNGNPVVYAQGWAVNNVPNWWHNGYLQGTQSLLVRTHDRYGPSGTEEFIWSAMTNSNNSPSSDTPDINLDSLMWTVVKGVSAWPAHDLF
ncbi:beta-lactamase [Myxococcus stipitatus DSM 14675]|uniref:Beta-lactamase n=1 Tax=Myxococcus stipitatus (strain DSM 14675 / JCM 12634 / Mx s8) TaxID=1278073 RepID=L7UG63_MYXSD|nr:serine hydrolase [Myxococcus stipitatus]AGC47013.1 beta-lactamase [Myxococcus stipitatus DSM 14675]